MKIIEPINNLGSLSTSNAQVDEIEAWAPTGRDLLTYIYKPVFDVVGDKMVITSSTASGFVYVVDLSTGDVINTNYTTAKGVFCLKISPNGSYAALAMDGLRVIISLSTYAVVYSKTSGTIEGSLYSPISWKSDSSKVYIGITNKMIIVDSPAWTETEVSFPANDSTILSTDAGVFWFSNSFSDNTLRKLDFSGTVVATLSSSPVLYALAYNDVADDLLGLTYSNDNSIVKINPATLAIEVTPAGISGTFFSGSGSLKVSGTSLIARSLSTSPYWRYYSLTDYSFTKSLIDFVDRGESIAVGSNYTVIQQTAGIGLIDNTDDSKVHQQNPSVLAGDKYIYENNIYEAIIDNNDQPDEGALLEVPTWLDSGKVNPLRMFDGKLDSITTSSSDLSIVISPQTVVSGIAFFNVDASSIQITMTDPVDGLVFDSGLISMIDNSGINNWFEFYNAPYIERSNLVSLSLPAYIDASIEVTISSVSGSVSIGEIVVGRVLNIGISQFGTSVGILDFSEKEQDQFGNFNIIERKFSKRADYDVKIPTNTVSGVQRTLSKFRATPVVWVGDVDREETIIYGYYKSFDIVLSNPALSDTSILVEGL